MSCTDNADFLQRKQDQRNKLRQEYWKLVSRPREAGNSEAIFDPALMRYQAMEATRMEYFKPTFSASKPLLFLLLPMAGLCYLLKTTRDAQEEKYRTGQVAYKDREFKCM